MQLSSWKRFQVSDLLLRRFNIVLPDATKGIFLFTQVIHRLRARSRLIMA